jgi:hypothetical protein
VFTVAPANRLLLLIKMLLLWLSRQTFYIMLTWQMR